ncbi:MAG: hypothetical protein ACYDFQ_09820, partial [Vulcanimicrobiaceae bacterium]
MHDDLGKSEAALIAARRDDLAALRSRGRDPFVQVRYSVDASAAGVLAQSAHLGPEERAAGRTLHLAGRLMLKRTMGKTIFADL